MTVNELINELNTIPEEERGKTLVCRDGYYVDMDGIEHNIKSTIGKIRTNYPMNDIIFFELDEIV